MADPKHPQNELPPNMSVIQITFDAVTRDFNMLRAGRAAKDWGEVYLMHGLMLESILRERIGEGGHKVVPASSILAH